MPHDMAEPDRMKNMNTKARQKKVRRPSKRGNLRQAHRRGGELAAIRKWVKFILPRLGRGKRRFGLGVVVAVVKRSGDEIVIRPTTVEESNDQPGERPRGRLLARADPRRMSRLFSGLAHPDRVRVLTAILNGANTHQLLKEATRLKTGPLYFHIRGLQAAGLVDSATRNSYLPTVLGEDALLVNTVLVSRKA
jgi:hypothetical protein